MELNCLYCGNKFEAQRVSAKYCSANCRMAQSRKNSESEKEPEEEQVCNNDIFDALIEIKGLLLNLVGSDKNELAKSKNEVANNYENASKDLLPFLQFKTRAENIIKNTPHCESREEFLE